MDCSLSSSFTSIQSLGLWGDLMGGQQGAGVSDLSFHLESWTHPFPGLTHKLSAINTLQLPTPCLLPPTVKEKHVAILL